MTIDAGIVLVSLAAIIMVGVCVDRWFEHKEIMAGKRVLAVKGEKEAEHCQLNQK